VSKFLISEYFGKDRNGRAGLFTLF